MACVNDVNNNFADMSDSESYGDDDFDDDFGLLKKALDVELPDDFDPNKIPQTGEEYLQHVIYERSKCKTWVTADIDKSKFKSKQTFKITQDQNSVITPTTFLPTLEWQLSKIDDFKQFRNFIQSKITNNQTVASFDEDAFKERILHEKPSFSEMSTYAQAAKIRMLQMLSKYLDSMEKDSGIDQNIGTWLYAVLALLDIPLSPDTCFTVREFAKRCINARSKLSENVCKDIYMPFNLYICIASRFFNQLDLADSS